MENQFKSETSALDNLKRVREDVLTAMQRYGRNSNDVQIMAVTKTVPPQIVNAVLDNGISLIGENKVQEFLSKENEYHLENANVHFIGHLQTNKVRQIIDKVSMIESVSSIKLAQEIERCAKNRGKAMDILLEVNIGNEETKTGFFKAEIDDTLNYLSKLPHIKVRGLMCIPPKDDSEKFFSDTSRLFIDIREKNMDNINMDFLSMGMSNDYVTAIKYGSNIVRLGSVLFGARNYIA